MTATLPSAPDTSELRRLADLTPELALREAATPLARLARNPTFLEMHILPLLEESRDAEDWYAVPIHDAPDSACSLQVFVWPPGTRTQVHDHTTWGAYCCAVGSVLEERFERLDDGSQLDYARLKQVWQMSWSRRDGASTVLPRDEGIHRVGNPGAETAISVHLYGPRMGDVDGRDYDPSRDYVCDRVDA
jgi:predicted metal-dependent enzyme (double-stranded beta helix superfamily)